MIYLFIISCGIEGALLSSMGYAANTWQYWAFIVTTAIIYLTGRMYQ